MAYLERLSSRLKFYKVLAVPMLYWGKGQLGMDCDKIIEQNSDSRD
jgi:hypothetical protein